MSSSNHKKTNSNLFMQSSSVEKLHSKKGTWQRVNLKLKKKGLRATLTYSIKTKIHEVPLWIDKSRQANSKEIMAVDGGMDGSIGWEFTRGNGKTLIFRADTPEEAEQWVTAVNDCLSGSDREEMSNQSDELSLRLMELSQESRDFNLIERQLVKEFGLRTVRKNAAEIEQLKNSQTILKHNKKRESASNKHNNKTDESSKEEDKMDSLSGTIAIEGYLEKRPRGGLLANLKAWQRRWVVVNWGSFQNDREMPHARIDYFEDESLQVFKKAISLTAASTVSKATEYGGEFEFVCYARGGEMFYLRAESEKDRTRWISCLQKVIDRLVKEQDRRVRHAEFVSEIRIQMQSQEKIVTEKKKKRVRRPSDRHGRRPSQRAGGRFRLNSSMGSEFQEKLEDEEDEEEITMASLPRAVKRYVILDAKLEKRGNSGGSYTMRDVLVTTEFISYSAAETVSAKITSQLRSNNRNVSLMKVSSVESKVPDEPLAFAVRTSNGMALIFRANTKEQHLQWTSVLKRIHSTNARLLGRSVIVQGWLTKRARALPYNWNRRFFRLYMPNKRSDTKMSKAETIRQDLATLVVSGVMNGVASGVSGVASRMGSIYKSSSKIENDKKKDEDDKNSDEDDEEEDGEEENSEEEDEEHLEKEDELEAKLTYFTDNVTMIPQNAVRLCKRSRIEMKLPTQLDGKEFAFVIKTGLGTPDFCAHADSEEERQLWIKKIVYMVQRLDQPAWLREWASLSSKQRVEKIVERYEAAVEGERITKEDWFDAAHSVLNDVEILCRECVKDRASGARAPEILLEHIRIYHDRISSVSSLRFIMSAKERQRRSTGKEESIEARLVILELQNRYLQVMLAALSLCTTTMSEKNKQESQEEDEKTASAENTKKPLHRKKSTILMSGDVEHMGKNGPILGGGYKTSWHVVRAGRFEWYRNKSDPKPKSFVFLRGFTIKLDESDECVFTLLRPEKSTWDRNVKVRVKKGQRSYWVEACKKSIEMANRATVEDATDSLVEDDVKTSFDSDDSFDEDDDFDIGEIEEKIESISKMFNINLGEVAQCMALNESIHRRAVVRNVRNAAKDLVAKVTDVQIATPREREAKGLYFYVTKQNDDVVHTRVMSDLLSLLKKTMTSVGCCSAKLRYLLLRICCDEATRYQQEFTNSLTKTPIVDIKLAVAVSNDCKKLKLGMLDLMDIAGDVATSSFNCKAVLDHFDGCASTCIRRIVKSACLHSKLSSRFYEVCKRPFDRQSDDVASTISIFRANMRRSLRIGMSHDVKRHTLMFCADVLIVSYMQALLRRRDDEKGSIENLMSRCFKRDEICNESTPLSRRSSLRKSWGARESTSKQYTARRSIGRKRSSNQFDLLRESHSYISALLVFELRDSVVALEKSLETNMVKSAEDVADEILKFCAYPPLLSKQEIVPFLENEYGLTTGVRVVTFIRDITGKIKNLSTEEDVMNMNNKKKKMNSSSSSMTERQRVVRKWVQDIGYRTILTDLRSIAQCVNGWWHYLGASGHFKGGIGRRRMLQSHLYVLETFKSLLSGPPEKIPDLLKQACEKLGVRVANVASVFEICVKARADMPADVKSGTLSRIGAYTRFHASDEMSLDRQNFERACLKKGGAAWVFKELASTISESTSSEMMNRGAANAKVGTPSLKVAEGDTILITCVEPSTSIVAGYQVRFRKKGDKKWIPANHGVVVDASRRNNRGLRYRLGADEKEAAELPVNTNFEISVRAGVYGATKWGDWSPVASVYLPNSVEIQRATLTVKKEIREQMVREAVSESSLKRKEDKEEEEEKEEEDKGKIGAVADDMTSDGKYVVKVFYRLHSWRVIRSYDEIREFQVKIKATCEIIQVPVPSMPNKFASMFLTQSQKLSNMNEFFNEIMKNGSMFVGLPEVLDFFEIVTRDRIVAHVVGLTHILDTSSVRKHELRVSFKGASWIQERSTREFLQLHQNLRQDGFDDENILPPLDVGRIEKRPIDEQVVMVERYIHGILSGEIAHIFRVQEFLGVTTNLHRR